MDKNNHEKKFLDLIARGINEHPEELIPATEMDRAEILALIENLDVDIDTLEVRVEAKTRPNTLRVSAETLAAVVESTKQSRRIDALNELSQLDQDMGRFDD